MVAPFQIRDDAVVGAGIGLPPVVFLIKIFHRPVTRPVKQEVAGFLRQVLERRAQFEFEILCQRFHHLVETDGGFFLPGMDRPVADRKRRVGHHQVGIDLHLVSQPIAFETGAGGIIEREQARLQLRITDAAVTARELFTEQQFLVLFRFSARQDGNHQTAVAQLQGGFDGFRQSLAHLAFDDQAVHHRLDRVLELFVEFDAFFQLAHFAVDPGPDEAFFLEFEQVLFEFPLAVCHEGRQDHHLAALRDALHLIGDLLNRLRSDLASATVTKHMTDAGVQQPHVIVNFGDGADGGPGIFTGGFLFDGDGGRQALDVIDIWFLHQFQKLPGVGGQRFDIAALALGVDGIERERGFAGPAETGDDHQLFPRQGQIDVFQVVLAGTFDGYIF